jgi:superfamily I DNA/RNA helicase
VVQGLEFSHVLLCGVSEISTGGDDDEVGKRRLLYVGMTRATDVLYVTVQGTGPIGADLLRAAR